MAWITTKDGKHINTDWFDKEKQIAQNKAEANSKNIKTGKEEERFKTKRGRDFKFDINHDDKKIWVSSRQKITTGYRNRKKTGTTFLETKPTNEVTQYLEQKYKGYKILP